MIKLTEKQIKTLKLIVKSGITDKFYLVGGTALTIRYSHRFSYDFDFFLLPEKKIFNFELLLNKIPIDKIIDLEKDTLIFQINEILFSFFKYEYPLLERPEYYKKFFINIASDEDIAAMKASAIIQRGDKKDFFDLYYLLNINKWDISDIINFCNKKYKKYFNPSIFFKALIYFEDADKQKIDEIDKIWVNIKNYFKESVNNYFKN